MRLDCGGIVAKLWHVPGLFHVFLHGCYAPGAYRSWFVPFSFSVCSDAVRFPVHCSIENRNSPLRGPPAIGCLLFGFSMRFSSTSARFSYWTMKIILDIAAVLWYNGTMGRASDLKVGEANEKV
jgi:hypothetical protein